jgi:hypothetical protein
MRFFATTSAELYEETRQTLDTAWGLPDGRGTLTCINPVGVAPRDSDGRILLAVADEWCLWEPAATLLPVLLQQGAVAEIDRAAYMAAVSYD